MAAHHSQSLEGMFIHVPGLKVVAPSTPYDVKGLLKTAIRDDDPVIFITHKRLLASKGHVPDEEYLVPLGKGEVKRRGDDVTIVSWLYTLTKSIAAAEKLEEEGINVEVIDPRTLKPLDNDTIVNSVKKTTKAVVVHEGYKTCGVGAEIAAQIMENAFDYLDAPVARVAGEDVPIPMSPVLEEAAIPNKEKIIAAVKKIL